MRSRRGRNQGPSKFSDATHEPRGHLRIVDGGDFAFYSARKRNINDFNDLGAFLIMNEALGAATLAQVNGRSAIVWCLRP